MRKEENGLSSQLQRPIEETVNAGDEIIIYSDKEYYEKETIYLTIYYSFVPDSREQKKPSLEKLFSSDDYEVYRVN